MLNPLSECLGVSVSELLNGERNVTSTDSAIELDSVITYAQQSSHSINTTFRRMVGTIFSIVMLLGIVVCMICNFAVTGALTWSLYPISSIIFVWAVTFPLIVHQQKGMLISLCSVTVLLCPFIWVLSRLTGVGMVFVVWLADICSGYFVFMDRLCDNENLEKKKMVCGRNCNLWWNYTLYSNKSDSICLVFRSCY